MASLFQPLMRPLFSRPVVSWGTHTSASGGGWSAAQLDAFIAAQSDGLYFDTTKTDRFFQENTGPTLADDVGEAMGLALSQRAWAGQTLAEVLAAQTNRLIPGSWAMSVAGGTTTAVESPAGTITIVGDGANSGRADQSFATVVGRTYRFSSLVAQNNFALSIGTAQGGGQNINSIAWPVGTQEIYFVATATTTWVRLFKSGATTSVASGISAKEVPGKHGIQATGTLKPVRQTAGAKFDGLDDNWLTSYTAGAGENFIVALVDVPASLSANQYFFGSYKASGALRFHLGFDPTGLVRYGLGTASAAVGGDRRGTTCVVGMSTDGSTFRVFDENVEAASGAMSGAAADVACRLGALNFDGTASSFFGGSIKKLVAGRQFLDLSTYRQIRNALLAA